MAGAVVAQGTHECWVGGEGKGSLSPSPLRLFPFLQGGQGSLGWVGRVGFDPPAPPGALISPRTTAILPHPLLCFVSHLALHQHPTVPMAREPPWDLLRPPDLGQVP